MLRSSYTEPPSANDNLRCTFADRNLRSYESLSLLHHNLTASQYSNGPNWFLLHTCERAEVYSADRSEDQLLPILSKLGNPVGIVTGQTRVLLRLAEIAAGLRSALLAERFIYQQVKHSGANLDPLHPMSPIVSLALSIAKTAREQYQFTAAVDYPELAHEIFADFIAKGKPSDVIVIVGSGMLAQALAAHPITLQYKKRLAITRSPKKLRRRFSDTGNNFSVIGPNDWEHHLRTSRWHVVIATNNLVTAYADSIRALVSAAGCDAAVDLSSVPLYQNPEPDHYITMYHKQLIDKFDRQNEAISDLAEKVRDSIAMACGTIV